MALNCCWDNLERSTGVSEGKMRV